MTDEYPDEEFAPIAAELKRLPYFAPSSRFADSVMARVSIPQPGFVPVRVPAVAEPHALRPRSESRVRAPAAQIARPAHYFPRSLPARIAAVALLGSLSATMSVVALVAMFQMDLLVFVAQVLGDDTIGFLAFMVADAAGSIAGAATGSLAAAGAASGLAIAGSFAAGIVAATAGLRAAASTNRKAA